MRKRWSALSANNIVRAQHWRHDDGPRPTLCVIHGFMGSSYLVNGRFFTLPWYYRSGYDVLMYTLPFHGERAERFSPFGGFGYFAGGLGGFAEAMAQAVHDFRSIVDYLRHTGVERVALTGISLGGYTSALVARSKTGSRPSSPTAQSSLRRRCSRNGSRQTSSSSWACGSPTSARDELTAGLSYHGPLNYRPLVPKDRRMIITGLGRPDGSAGPGR